MITGKRRNPGMMTNTCNMEKKIEKFFKEYVEEKWQPSVVPFSWTDANDNLRRLNDAIFNIGRRLVGNSFTLDASNQRIYENAALFIMGQEGDWPLDKGLFIWGRVGCGKTVLMQVIGMFAQIFAKRNGFRMDHCHELSHKFQIHGGPAFDEYRSGPVCFDELGSEPLTTSYFGTQVHVMPMHIEKRYRLFTKEGRWTHFTSNFDLAWIAENYGKREADRLKEMCTVIKMEGGSRRK